MEIPYDFYLGKYEVTQEEWQKLTGLNPSDFKAVCGIDKPAAMPTPTAHFPVEQRDLDDCQEFIKSAKCQAQGALPGCTACRRERGMGICLSRRAPS